VAAAVLHCCVPKVRGHRCCLHHLLLLLLLALPPLQLYLQLLQRLLLPCWHSLLLPLLGSLLLLQLQLPLLLPCPLLSAGHAPAWSLYLHRPYLHPHLHHHRHGQRCRLPYHDHHPCHHHACDHHHDLTASANPHQKHHHAHLTCHL
jgi:hypothetical protein